MSLEPQDDRHLRITRMEDGVVIYEGPGRVHIGLDPAAGPSPIPEDVRPLITFDEIRADLRRQRPGPTMAEVDEIARRLPPGVLEQIPFEPDADPLRIQVPEPDMTEVQRLVDQWIPRGSPFQRAFYENALRPDEAEQMAELEIDLSRWEEAVERMRTRFLTQRSIREAYGFSEAELGLLPEGEGIRPPDWRAAFERNEEAITSARSEFPYDPLAYGRIYPGDAGTSRWTPPEDPDEKIRSCP